MSMFLAMASATIDELDSEERLSVEPRLFARIIAICADVAEQALGHHAGEDAMPKLPMMQLVRVDLLMSGDRVWREDFAFDVVERVERSGATVAVAYDGGRTEELGVAEHKRVAVSRAMADEWNLERVTLDARTLESFEL